MRKLAFFIAVLLTGLNAFAAAPKLVRPFEQAGGLSSTNPIDALVLAKLSERGITPANPCSDEVFIRRVYLDVIGTLPEPEAVRQFLKDPAPDKRAALIDALMKRDEFADYWSLKWCDLLRVKAEFPIDLWPNAVQAYHRWIHDAVRHNMPYDQFARALLTSSGSNFRVPPVNFYRAIQGHEPASIAGAVALTFMGTRIAKWPKAESDGMAAFFSRLAYKKTDEWKEEIVCPDPKPAGPLKATFPGGATDALPGSSPLPGASHPKRAPQLAPGRGELPGETVQISPDKDPREVFADWLITPKNPWFARNIVNRVWAWLFGRGIINEPDDIRPDNPPANPELLAYLEKELVSAKYDLRHIYRLILNSGVYQESSIPRGNKADAEAVFACYPVRRLDAEVLIDALDWLGETGESYSSAIPEPFTFIPEDHRTIALADGSITSPFLEMFGRPPRDSGLESERNNQPTDAQRLNLLNSTDVQRKVANSPRLRKAFVAVKWKRDEVVRLTYLSILSRFPTKEETVIALKYFSTPKLGTGPAAEDLAWALVNSKEFLYRH